MAKLLLIGATGLIGRQLLDLLMIRGDTVHVLTRRVTGASGASLTEIIADPSEWPALAADAKADKQITIPIFFAIFLALQFIFISCL